MGPRDLVATYLSTRWCDDAARHQGGFVTCPSDFPSFGKSLTFKSMDPYTPQSRPGTRKKHLGLSVKEFTKVSFNNNAKYPTFQVLTADIDYRYHSLRTTESTATR
jgi:hypothetical protein